MPGRDTGIIPTMTFPARAGRHVLGGLLISSNEVISMGKQYDTEFKSQTAMEIWYKPPTGARCAELPHPTRRIDCRNGPRSTLEGLAKGSDVCACGGYPPIWVWHYDHATARQRMGRVLELPSL